eukprot:UN25187
MFSTPKQPFVEGHWHVPGLKKVLLDVLEPVNGLIVTGKTYSEDVRTFKGYLIPSFYGHCWNAVRTASETGGHYLIGFLDWKKFGSQSIQPMKTSIDLQ